MSSKRPGNFTASGKRTKRSGDDRPTRDEDDDGEELTFEDPFPDELDEMEEGVAEEPAGMDEEDEEEAAAAVGASVASAAETAAPAVQTYVPGKHAPAETMDYDSSAYHMFHHLNVEWPCLSFDVIRDNLGVRRTKFPMTCYIAAGTQASAGEKNSLMLIKLTDLSRTKYDDESDAEDEDDSDVDDDATLTHKTIPHRGGVNRIRCMPQQPHVMAAWSDTGSVGIWNAGAQIQSLDGPATLPMRNEPVHVFSGHRTEGFALGWSPVTQGRLVTGDCAKGIHLWQMADAGGTTWKVDPTPFGGHKGSVEDLQWSPVEREMFVSGSVDRTVRVWDARVGGPKRRSVASVVAHESDVNVVACNPFHPNVVASGGDDGVIKVWDIKSFKEPMMQLYWHMGPITSLEWSPEEESVLAASGEDDQITLWDLQAEVDTSDPAAAAAMAAAAAQQPNLQEIPPQLLFIHQGQRQIKELHFHPQLPGVLISTSADGFHVFKPAVEGEEMGVAMISGDSDSEEDEEEDGGAAVAAAMEEATASGAGSASAEEKQ